MKSFETSLSPENQKESDLSHLSKPFKHPSVTLTKIETETGKTKTVVGHAVKDQWVEGWLPPKRIEKKNHN